MKILFILSGFAFLLACKKVDDRRCWKGEGKVSTVDRELDGFHYIETNGAVEIHLVQDTVSYARLTCGEKLMGQIETIVQDKHLRVNNHNKCSFLRPKADFPILEIHFVNIDTLLHLGSGNLNTLNTLKTNNLHVLSLDNSSHLELDIEVNNFQFHTSDSWTDLTVSGSTKKAQFFLKGNAFSDARNLQVDGDAVVLSRSVGDLKIGPVSQVLKVDISSKGNVYYQGNPAQIELIDTGEGELIKE